MLDNINILGWDYFLLMLFLWSMACICYQIQNHPTTIRFHIKKHSLDVSVLRLVFIVLGLMAALRGLDIANDTMAYYSAYHYFKLTNTFLSTYMEAGYVALNLFIAKIFPHGDTGFHILVFLTSIFCYWSVEQWIEKHAKTYGISFLTFYFLLNSFFISAIRQSIAISIILIALTWLERGYKFRFILGVILASLFHISALVSFIFLFFYNKKFNYKWGLLFFLGAILITLFDIQQPIIELIKPNTKYVFGEIGNLVNVLILSSFYLALLFVRIFTKQKSYEHPKGQFRDDFFSFCILIALSITILSLKGPIINRLGYYFSFAGIPYIANTLYRIKNRKFANIFKIIFCIIFWGYSLSVLIFRPEWNHLWPYHFFWN